VGTVRSTQEGEMAGVLVTARQVGSTITTTVVTDQSGRYQFPGDRLASGSYQITIRAAGYELSSPSTAVLNPDKTATADLNLRPASNLSLQLTAAEWLMSAPGTQEEKSTLYRCVACHDLTPVMQSRYDAKTWPETLRRMAGWEPPSVLTSPVPVPGSPPALSPDPKFVAYLASINLHGRKDWPFKLRAFPRPTARAIVTEYDLPGPSLPHDAAVGHDGFIYYNDFQRPLIGRLDPRNGQAKEWTLPVLRPGYPEGSLTIKIDKDGNAWNPRFFQGCVLVKLDTRTEQLSTWSVPADYNGKESRCGHVALGAPDGRVWMSDSGGRRMFLFDPRTGAFKPFESFPNYTAAKTAASIETAGRKSTGHRTYGIGVDSKGTGYFADIAGGTIGEIDPRSGEVHLYPTPTPASGPRRTYMDSTGHYWFGENYSSKLGMFDTKTKQIREWDPPVPFSGPYPAVRDKNGDVWTAGMSTDYVFRFNPDTGTFTSYLLPTLSANIRRIDVDNSTTPVTIWVAEVHQGKLAKIEPLP
jgi:virginiamycin B lyase